MGQELTSPAQAALGRCCPNPSFPISPNTRTRPSFPHRKPGSCFHQPAPQALRVISTASPNNILKRSEIPATPRRGFFLHLCYRKHRRAPNRPHKHRFGSNLTSCDREHHLRSRSQSLRLYGCAPSPSGSSVGLVGVPNPLKPRGARPQAACDPPYRPSSARFARYGERRSTGSRAAG